MFNILKKRIKNEKGLSLVELLAVIVILGIVAAIAIPAIGNIIENSRYNAVKADAINVINAANLYYTDNPGKTTAVTVPELISGKYLDSSGKIPNVAQSTVTPTNPRALTATVPNVIGAFSVTFSGTATGSTLSTIDNINKDTKKGSTIDANYAVGTTTTTP
ncbi:prepilin-type N-terminal cleavage/methylation domain-containing protein [Solibacillus sp. FSL W8-0372]|uniref:prepilin-type N-terminal cleavage/methylation domain-containing protein n=1 Tax=Solibacillus sp. FSL W8-0372 TaxID=2921713 RepID=UPI0030D2A69B